ncbi:hypothetical protein [Arthrobacter sp. B6]|uniref:hypothetical protein n=1 Tax=Arthrobacter sp. B6 TaxID=1570137 RepID=UPI000A6E1BF5|nr:hypothetical protein [Arthrobacter sp. B6]
MKNKSTVPAVVPGFDIPAAGIAGPRESTAPAPTEGAPPFEMTEEQRQPEPVSAR